jgi:hypothetical protein
VVQVDSRHELMAEQPDAVLDALFAFAQARQHDGPPRMCF